MAKDKSNWAPSKSDRHNRLYKAVGSSLLEVERLVLKNRVSVKEAQDEFRISTSTVPVEVLESFLEDLLSLGSSDKSLYIHPGRISLASIGLSFLLPFAAFLIFVIFALQQEFEFNWTYSLCLAGFVTLALLYAAPRSKTRRRFMFAQILSREISRRRGQGDSDYSSTGKVIFGSFFDWRKGTSQGAARSIFH